MTIRGKRPQRATLVDVALAAHGPRQTVRHVMHTPGHGAHQTLAKVRACIDRPTLQQTLAPLGPRQRAGGGSGTAFGRQSVAGAALVPAVSGRAIAG